MMSRTAFFTCFLLLVGMAFSSCSKKINEALVSRNGSIDLKEVRDTLTVNFLGTACFLAEYRGKAVLTDPFVSNPPLRHMISGKMEADSGIVFDFVKPEMLERVSLVVIGHAHYDHLLDLPLMGRHIPAEAKIAGSNTAYHIIAPAALPQQKVQIAESAATYIKTGQWIYSADGMMRVMPVVSDHPPHFLGITLYGGVYKNDLEHIPKKGKKWKMGEPYVFLVDMLDESGAIEYRLWFQSSGSVFPLGFFPESVLEEKKVDIAFVAIATNEKPAKYPVRILDFLQPQAVVLSHWENFWRNKYKPVKTVQKGNPEKLFLKLSAIYDGKAEIILPMPGSVFRFY